ncbi:MAG: hypothetical protein LH615_00565 [Ferruginibacter sp.]|nr:hypothetical protein [Ferruginibacter sp.]
MPLTKVWAKAGLDNQTSAMCNHQHWLGLTFIHLAFGFYLQLYIFNWAFVPGSYSIVAILNCSLIKYNL